MSGVTPSPEAMAAAGRPYVPEDANLPIGQISDFGFYEGVEDDHANFPSAGTWVEMNEPEVFSIYSYPGDIDVFKIKSANLPNEGVLKLLNQRPYDLVTYGQLWSELHKHLMHSQCISRW